MSGARLRPEIADELNSGQRAVCEGMPTQSSSQTRANILNNDWQLFRMQSKLKAEVLSYMNIGATQTERTWYYEKVDHQLLFQVCDFNVRRTTCKVIPRDP